MFFPFFVSAGSVNMTIDEMIERNAAWSREQSRIDPGFFERMSRGQSPEYLWIGCADSRVAPSRLLDMEPGRLFVHRNIANLVQSGDLNLLSVVHYAVNALGIRKVLICGHHGCGGVQAAMSRANHGLVDHWLTPIVETWRANRSEIEALSSPEQRLIRLCELNVLAQVERLRASPIIRRIEAEGEQIEIHPLVYELETGRLRTLS